MNNLHLQQQQVIFDRNDNLQLQSPSADDASHFISNITLSRLTSNPLVREYSNLSVASEEGGAHFIPFGRDSQYLEELANTDTAIAIDFAVSSPLPFSFTPKADIQLPQISHYSQIRTNPKSPRDDLELPEYKVPLRPINPINNIMPIQVPQPSRFQFGENIISKSNRFERPSAPKPPIPQQKQANNLFDISGMNIADIIKQNFSLKQLLKHSMVLKLIKHGAGSRFIQQKLHNASNELRDQVLYHIIFEEDDLLICSKDIYGNYVMQIFFEHGSQSQHQLLIQHLLMHNMMELSRSPYGCRVVQKAMECVDKTALIPLVAELNNDLIRDLIVGHNANHVIQKVLGLGLECKHIRFVIDEIDKDICYYAQHIFGCRIVQSIISHYGHINDKELIFKHFISSKQQDNDSNVLNLCISKYGNYVIQDILQLKYGDDDCQQIKNNIIRKIFKNVWFLSKNKFGSNVVEKCVTHSSVKQIDFLLKQIAGKNAKFLGKMMNDKFANYCVQKLLVSCNEKQQKKLIYSIEANVDSLRSTHYGKHIMEKVKQIKHRLDAQNYYK